MAVRVWYEGSLSCALLLPKDASLYRLSFVVSGLEGHFAVYGGYPIIPLVEVAFGL